MLQSSRGCDCCWAELLRSHRPAVTLFTCLRAWRYVVLQHKHRRNQPSAREWQHARFFEMELPLHAVVTALDHDDDAMDEAFELLGAFYALYPRSTEFLDHHVEYRCILRRPALHYALEQRWGLEKLSWLVDKSLDVVLEKDSDGLAIVTHAIVNKCPEELAIRLAVAAAARCIIAVDELLSGQHFESARRFCHRALQDFFPGVPKFPHARCREIIGQRRQNGEDQARVAATAIRDVWTQFIDTWGHFGAPLLQRDLPEALYPVIDSFVEVSLVAKGEPLTYQWFMQLDGQDEGSPIEGATQSFIFLSPSIQPHNQGTYYCEVVNRRGRVVSTRMLVRVVDDRVPPDPTLNFTVDRALLTTQDYTLRCLKASTGGWVRHSQMHATVVFQPDFFTCLDREGLNVSDAHGVEIAISRRVDLEATLRLRHGETLVSCVVEVLPTSMGELLRPALLWLPHCLVVDTNNSAVVVEIDTKSGRILRDVEHTCVSEAYARVTISRLGAFAVISRRKTMRSGESSSDFIVESARFFLIRPKYLSATPPTDRLKLSLALVRDLENYCTEAEAQLKDKFAQVDDPTLVGTIDSFKLNIRENFSLNLDIGGEARVVFRWPPPSPEVMVADVEISVADLVPSNSKRTHPACLSLPLRAAVCKTPAQTRTRLNTADNKSSEAMPNSEWTLFEREWRVLVPVLRDAKTVFAAPPPTPLLIERTSGRLVLDLTPPEDKGAAGEPHDDMESSNFTPYFYVVEIATFSPTFWRRYDQTWWFDKTKTNVIDGMYKVVHRGFGTKVTIFTSAYAGCVRVAWSSIDRFGAYSEPLLLRPLAEADLGIGSPLKGGGVFESFSAELERTSFRLAQLMSDLHIDPGMLNTVYGLSRSVKTAADVVMALLEAKTTLGTCNFELALLLSGFKSLERQISRIKIASNAYAALLERLVRVQRIIPELDWFAESTRSISRRLHELLKETFEVVAKLSRPGWLQHFLMNESFEDTLNRICTDTAGLLASGDCGLECTSELRAQLETPTRDTILWIMKTSRAYLLIAVGRLQEATDQHTKLLICHELCHTLGLYRASPQLNEDDEELRSSLASELLAEMESPTSQQALLALRQQDCLANHLVQVTPSDGEKCFRVPEAVHLDLDPFIRGVNRTGMHVVIRVANVTLDSCVVQGKASFCERTSRLSFFPAAEFERKSRYRVTVREREILSSLGGTLPDRPPFTIHFSTPA